MNILALDYGTKTGYCFGSDPANLQCGTWTLATPREVAEWGKSRRTRTRDPRMARLATYLRQFPLADIVVFEDVQFASSTYQVQLWASLRSVAWLDYPDTTRFECVPVSTLKKFATGAGNATKDKMAAALDFNFSSRLPCLPIPSSTTRLDDNAIDAIWIWLWAQQTFSRA